MNLSIIVEDLFLNYSRKIPHSDKKTFLIGITGSSGAGKSTFSLKLHEAWKRMHPDLSMTVIQTDNFIYSNHWLESHQLMDRKGFPESFDFQGLKHCIKAIQQKSGLPVWTPYYSQVIKDIIPDEKMAVHESDIYLFEGVNLFFDYPDFNAAKFLDFSIYLDTPRNVIKQRALDRFFAAYEQSKITPTPYFKKFSDWTKEAIQQYAEQLWETMDMVLLKDHIEPHKSLATLVLQDC